LVGWLVDVGGTVTSVSLLLIDQLIQRGKILLEEQVDSQLVKKFAACNGSREFNYSFHSTPPLSPALYL